MRNAREKSGVLEGLKVTFELVTAEELLGTCARTWKNRMLAAARVDVLSGNLLPWYNSVLTASSVSSS